MQQCRIHDILVWIRIRIRILLFSFLTFKTPTFKEKVQKKSQNSRNQGFSYYFCLGISAGKIRSLGVCCDKRENPFVTSLNSVVSL